MSRGLDKFDIRLLNLLQSNNLATAEALAAKVPLSPSAITRRVRRLREEGIITADRAVLSGRIAGRRLKAIVRLELSEHAPEAGLTELRDSLAAAQEVQSCAEISGPFDLFLTVVTRDMEAFNAFADHMLAANPAVRRYETSFVKREIKNSTLIMLDEEDAR